MFKCLSLCLSSLVENLSMSFWHICIWCFYYIIGYQEDSNNPWFWCHHKEQAGAAKYEFWNRWKKRTKKNISYVLK